MELLFLGTGAADFSPALSGPLGKSLADRSLRRSTSTLLDGTILFDAGPHTPDCLALNGVDASRITDVLFTHLHSDHYNKDSLAAIAAAGKRTLRVWFREDGAVPLLPNTELHPMKIGETYDVSGYTVTALEANHDYFPLHYSVEKDGCRLFYGLDGAWLPYHTYYAMREKRYDVMVLDCTVGDYEGDFRLCEHNSVPMLRMMLKSFATWGVSDEKTLVVADHIARTLHKSHEELAAILEKDGMLPAYDGMRLSVQGRERA
jgi:phosphoribosyl 1,2-cyclic phosphate phosphodiesterase